MRKLKIILSFLFLFYTLSALRCTLSYANNIRVENATLYKSDSQPAGTVDVRFDVIWDNSFSGTDDNSQAFFDRAWIFVKYGTGDPTVWAHATLTTGGTLTTYSATTNTGITSDGIGAFASPGTGQTVRWDYDDDGLAGTETIKVRVMAIEMVYIPEGNFYAGDNETSVASLKQGASDADPWLVNDSDDMVMNGGEFYYVNEGSSGEDATGASFTIPAAFPNGYDAFYIMKYEVSQGQYRDFLNMLTRAQQTTRVAEIGTASDYAMTDSTTVTYRDSIRLPASIPGSGPVTFGCDLDGDGTFNESDDGEWLACNYLSWMDGAAYADWAGLRPMTELEFEKASRGGSATDNTVAGEYVWGTAYIAGSAYTLSNSGANNEDIATNYSTTADYGNCINSTTDGSIGGPLRCGIFAGNSNNTTRATAGASYYGVMELSGNLWERPVTVGNETGRSFTGTHGNGTLTSDGYADNSDWPGYVTSKISGATGSGIRGGGWLFSSTYARVSDRNHAAHTYTSRSKISGARASRTSP